MKAYLYPIASLTLLAGLMWSHGKAYEIGESAVKTEWQAAEARRKETESLALIERFRENERQYREQQEFAKQEGRRHENELQAIRNRHNADVPKRVPIDPAAFGCRVAAAEKTGTAGSDGQAEPGEAFLPESFASDLRQLVVEAEEVSADLRTLKVLAEACFE